MLNVFSTLYYIYISEVGNKTLFTLLQKARKLNLAVDLVSQLFDVMVFPVLLYGCEIYALYPHLEMGGIHGPLITG